MRGQESKRKITVNGQRLKQSLLQCFLLLSVYFIQPILSPLMTVDVQWHCQPSPNNQTKQQGKKHQMPKNHTLKKLRCRHMGISMSRSLTRVGVLGYHQWQWAVLHLFVPSGRKGSAKVSVSKWAQFALIGYSEKKVWLAKLTVLVRGTCNGGLIS